MTKMKAVGAAGMSVTQAVKVAIAVTDAVEKGGAADQSTSTSDEGNGSKMERAASSSRVSLGSTKRPKRLSTAKTKKGRRSHGSRKSVGSAGTPGKQSKTVTLKITVKSFLKEFSGMEILVAFVRKDTEATWLEFLGENKVPVTDPLKYLIKTNKSTEKLTDKISDTLSKYALSCRHLNTVIITPESPYPFNVKQEADEMEEINVDEGSSDGADFNYEAFVVANDREFVFQENQRRQREAENLNQQENADAEMTGEDNQAETTTTESRSGETASVSSSDSNQHQSPSLRMEEHSPGRISADPGSHEHEAGVVQAALPQMVRNVSIVQGRQSGERNPGMSLPQNVIPSNDNGVLSRTRNREAARNFQNAQQEVYAPVAGNVQPIQVQNNVAPVAPNEGIQMTRLEFGDLVRDHAVRALQSMSSEDILRIRDELLTLRGENRLYMWARHAPMTGCAILDAFHV